MRKLPILIVAALGLMATASAGLAQCPEDIRLQVQAAIELTDTRIEQAELLIADSDSRPAHDELALAVQIQARAKTELAAEHCRIAMDLTRSARDRVARAIALVRGLPSSLPDRARVQLERTREIIDRARDRIEECNDDRAQAMLRVAAEMQVRAEEAFRSDRFLASLQLTISARERALRALRLCNVQDNLHENAERALHRTDEVISRARDQVSENDSERARQILSQGVELQGRAYAEFRAEHFEASLRLTQSARAHAYRAIRISGGER
jgi:hypothetical protein